MEDVVPDGHSMTMLEPEILAVQFRKFASADGEVPFILSVEREPPPLTVTAVPEPGVLPPVLNVSVLMALVALMDTAAVPDA